MSVMYVNSYFENVTYKHDEGSYKNFPNYIKIRNNVFIQAFGTGILPPNLQFWIQHIVRRKVRYFK